MGDTTQTVDWEQRGIEVVRGLAMDAVQQANSGHPGTPMALAPLAHVLYTRIMRYDAADPEWHDRDRFVLSIGHASMLLYSMLHLCGFGVSLDDIRAFRQWGSMTPGHPEKGHTPGVEVTTGPLGQGIANAVGLAIAEANLRERFGADLTDHHVFAIVGDGDLQEGVSHEAASLAGHLGLGRLVVVYDDNRITIDGGTDLSYSDDAATRFESYGWHVHEIGDVANDLDALEAGIRRAMEETDRPTLVVLRSHIGYPSPKFTDTSAAHGSALGADEVRVVKELIGLPVDETFTVPDEVLDRYRTAGAGGGAARAAWTGRRDAARRDDPARVAALEASATGRGLPGWTDALPSWPAGESVATRNACAKVLDAIVEVVPGLVGGGADLTGNTGTALKGASVLRRGALGGRQLFFGVREHGMGSVMVGMAEGGLTPFGGTFFVFSDYMRPAVRVAALSRSKVAFVWSHDSIAVGEDGPTHQPVEHLAALRAMPGLRIIRPADANETAAAWRVHLEGEGPTAIVLSRQNLPVLTGTDTLAADGVAAGAYVLVAESSAEPDVVLIGTGSEVSLCVEAHAALATAGLDARVVSMPSWDLFAARTAAERAAVLPAGVPRLAVEAGTTFGWTRWADDTIGLDAFGASAPGAVALERFGFTVDAVVARATALAGGR
ncbi:MAG: transketolase [Actinomycetes bacterium]